MADDIRDLTMRALQKMGVGQPDSAPGVLPDGTPEMLAAPQEAAAPQQGQTLEQMVAPAAAPAVEVPAVPPGMEPRIQLPELPTLTADSSRNPAPATGMSAPAPAVHPVVAEVIDKATTPTQNEVDQRAEELKQPIKAVKTEQAAVAKAHADTQESDDKEKQAIQQRIVDIDNRVRSKSLAEIMSSGSFGQKMQAGIAVMLGAVSQGLTGAKTNPVLDYLNQVTEQQAQKDKLSLEEKQSLQKQLLGIAEVKLKNFEAASTDVYRRAQAAEARANIELIRSKIGNSQLEQAQGKALSQALAQLESPIPAATPEIAKKNERTQEILRILDQSNPKQAENLRARTVNLPNGEIAIANKDPETVKNFNIQVRPTYEMPLNALRDLERFARTASRLDVKDRGLIESKLARAAGLLRIPYTGPGVFTEDEYRRILKTIGDPKASVFQMVEFAKLRDNIARLSEDLNTHSQAIGVQWPKDRTQMLADAIVKKSGGKISEDEALAAVLRSQR